MKNTSKTQIITNKNLPCSGTNQLAAFVVKECEYRNVRGVSQSSSCDLNHEKHVFSMLVAGKGGAHSTNWKKKNRESDNKQTLYP